VEQCWHTVTNDEPFPGYLLVTVPFVKVKELPDGSLAYLVTLSSRLYYDLSGKNQQIVDRKWQWNGRIFGGEPVADSIPDTFWRATWPERQFADRMKLFDQAWRDGRYRHVTGKEFRRGSGGHLYGADVHGARLTWVMLTAITAILAGRDETDSILNTRALILALLRLKATRDEAHCLFALLNWMHDVQDPWLDNWDELLVQFGQEA